MTVTHTGVPFISHWVWLHDLYMYLTYYVETAMKHGK